MISLALKVRLRHFVTIFGRSMRSEVIRTVSSTTCLANYVLTNAQEYHVGNTDGASDVSADFSTFLTPGLHRA